ncbi:MAG: enolase C-terminal domain-like protein [Thermodesulfobacteriota bacterium]|nr:enolase C-terminal domain-like protein [Thermodesulfobacteriota bacterium]
MTDHTIHIDVQPLRVKLKTTVRHSSATRNEGESVWVKAERNEIAGYGEGCPRSYVAGDDLESSVRWARENFSSGKVNFNTFEDIIRWTEKNSNLIDRYPSAWCAIEMALLDLFSREKNCSVETLVGMKGCRYRGRYTAVLGDDQKWKFTNQAEQYIIRGISDFKIKINGSLEKDRERLKALKDLCKHHNVRNVRIRLDANNFWAGRSEEAINYLNALNCPIFAIEEMVGSHDTEDISKVSLATGLPVILDESLCTFNDLSHYIDLPGKFIANIKVSRVGGIIRALRLIEELKKLGWPMIVGCHVGETSLLTRAALIPAYAAGDSLIAQEGAFGDYLVEKEPVDPILKFGQNGILDLSYPYYLETVRGFKLIPKENWNIGFGMQCRMPDSMDPDR